MRTVYDSSIPKPLSVRRSKARKTFVTATVSAGHWSLRLPKLKAGVYTIIVRATDRVGHVTTNRPKTLRLK